MASSRRDQWVNGPLYQFLCEIFPSYRSALSKFDVPRLAVDLGVSNECVYKWLRKGRITSDVALKILDLALSDENSDLLREIGTPQPSIRDFDEFVYGTR